jgi:hypothetical protein
VHWICSESRGSRCASMTRHRLSAQQPLQMLRSWLMQESQQYKESNMWNRSHQTACRCPIACDSRRSGRTPCVLALLMYKLLLHPSSRLLCGQCIPGPTAQLPLRRRLSFPWCSRMHATLTGSGLGSIRVGSQHQGILWERRM